MKDLFSAFFKFGAEMSQVAEKKTGSALVRVWLKELPQSDGDFLLLFGFAGSIENNGSFVDSVVSWEDENIRLVQALGNFGFSSDAAFVPRPLEVGIKLRDEDLDELEAMREEIDDAYDISAERIMERVIANSSQFMVRVHEVLQEPVEKGTQAFEIACPSIEKTRDEPLPKKD